MSNKYIVKPTTGEPEYTVEAGSVDVSDISGAVAFKDDQGNLIARLLNVSFRLDQTPSQ